MTKAKPVKRRPKLLAPTSTVALVKKLNRARMWAALIAGRGIAEVAERGSACRAGANAHIFPIQNMTPPAGDFLAVSGRTHYITVRHIQESHIP